MHLYIVITCLIWIQQRGHNGEGSWSSFIYRQVLAANFARKNEFMRLSYRGSRQFECSFMMLTCFLWASFAIITHLENWYIDNFTVTQENYPKASSGS